MFLSTLRRQACRRYLLKTATRRPFAFRFVSTAQQQPPLTDILPKDMAELESFTPKEPTKISTDMASGILDTTDFYCRHGISKQRFDQLAAAPQLPIIYKWQKMMEIYMTTQLHVVAGLGYSADDKGLTQYAQHLAVCIQSSDEYLKEQFVDKRRDTWRYVVSLVYDLQPEDIPKLSIVDARNLMHKVTSKMIEPDTLLEIQKRCTHISDPKPEHELAKKHHTIQSIIIDKVYLGGDPSIVSEAGFGSGERGYAKLQCALTDHEGDPLMAEYGGRAMMKVLETAGIDPRSLQQPGDQSVEQGP